MNKKSIITRSFALLMFLVSLAAAPYAGAAVITNHSATICKNYNGNEAGFVDYSANGIRSIKGSPQQIICPLTRNTSNSGGAWVYVNIRHNNFRTTRCTAYSYDKTGNLRASVNQAWTGVGLHEFQFNLLGFGKSGPWSDYSVLCTIPGNNNSILYSVDLWEQ